jgi:hypothetical protein
MSDSLSAMAHGDEVTLAIPRRDRGPVRVPVWFTVVDREVYVRPYRGTGAWWYRRAMAAGSGTASFGAQEAAVRFEAVQDDALIARISAEYSRKYARNPYTGSVTSASAEAATVRLTASPAVGASASGHPQRSARDVTAPTKPARATSPESAMGARH